MPNYPTVGWTHPVLTSVLCGDCGVTWQPDIEQHVCPQRPPTAHDPVNHPAHYTQGKIEVLDFIEDQGFGYLAGQVIKYVARYRFKGSPKQDLEKARFYLDRLIASTPETL